MFAQLLQQQQQQFSSLQQQPKITDPATTAPLPTASAPMPIPRPNAAPGMPNPEQTGDPGNAAGTHFDSTFNGQHGPPSHMTRARTRGWNQNTGDPMPMDASNALCSSYTDFDSPLDVVFSGSISKEEKNAQLVCQTTRRRRLPTAFSLTKTAREEFSLQEGDALGIAILVVFLCYTRAHF